MSKILTDQELFELTGIERGNEKRKDVLRRHGIAFIERKDGSIAVTWEVINEVLTRKSFAPDVSGPAHTPNFDAIAHS